MINGRIVVVSATTTLSTNGGKNFDKAGQEQTPPILEAVEEAEEETVPTQVAKEAVVEAIPTQVSKEAAAVEAIPTQVAKAAAETIAETVAGVGAGVGAAEITVIVPSESAPPPRFILYANTNLIDSLKTYFIEPFVNDHKIQEKLIKEAVNRLRGTNSTNFNNAWRLTEKSSIIHMPPQPPAQAGGSRLKSKPKSHITPYQKQALIAKSISTYLPIYIIKGARIALYQHLAATQALGSFSWKWLLADLILTIIVYTILSSIKYMPMSLELVLTDTSFGMIIISCATIGMNVLQPDTAHDNPATAIRIDNIVSYASPWILAIPAFCIV
jgi:hypothetical protein